MTWKADAQPRALRSADEIRAAERDGELTVEATGVIVNAPIVAAPGATRSTGQSAP